MEPLNNRFGGGVAESQITPQAVVILLIAIVLIFVLSRSKVIVPFLLAFFAIPIGQVLVVGGFHFTVLRILILAGLARMVISRKSSVAKFPGGFNGIDQVTVLWAVSAAIIISLQWMQTQALINALGTLIETLGAYVVVRFLIPDTDGIRLTIKTLAVICAIQGVCMIGEKITHFNVFGLIGGISTDVTLRDGHVRSAGVMGCLYAGAFAGALVPLFLWLWTEVKSRLTAFVGIVGATVMVITSYSSTSYMAIGGGLIALAFWPLRKSMRLVRWGFVAMLVSLHMVMKAPVWALIARIDLTGSSSGDHRYELLDNCIRHFWDWWLLGSRHYNDWGWGMWDLANQFVAVALTGGLLTLIFYIAIFKRSFADIGTTRKLIEGDKRQEWVLWCFGAPLFATIVASFGINYVPQMLTGFFALLACISVVTFEMRQTATQVVEVPGQRRLPLVPGRMGASAPVGTPITARSSGISTATSKRLMPWQKV
jgi:hypothetical protein